MANDIDKYLENLTEVLAQKGSKDGRVRELLSQARGNPEWTAVANAAVRLRQAFECERGEMETSSRSASQMTAALTEQPVPSLTATVLSQTRAIVGRVVKSRRPFVLLGLVVVILGATATFLVMRSPFGETHQVVTTGSDTGVSTNPEYSRPLPTPSPEEAAIASAAGPNLSPAVSLNVSDFDQNPEEQLLLKVLEGTNDFTSAIRVSTDATSHRVAFVGYPGTFIPLPLTETGNIDKDKWQHVFAKLNALNDLVSRNEPVSSQVATRMLQEVYVEAVKRAGEKEMVADVEVKGAVSAAREADSSYPAEVSSPNTFDAAPAAAPDR